MQHVSLALRGEIGWEIVGPLPDIGWRLRKHFYHVKSKNLVKDELWANWVDYGPDKYLDDKEMLAIIKSLNQIQVKLSAIHTKINAMLINLFCLLSLASFHSTNCIIPLHGRGRIICPRLQQNRLDS